MKTSKEVLKELIKNLKKATGKTQGQLAVEAGYAENSISVSMSRGDNLDPIINHLKLFYAKYLENESFFVENLKNKKTTTEAEMANDILNLKAVVKVLIEEIAILKEDRYKLSAEEWMMDMDRKRRIEFQRLAEI